jgi:8-oxo-dGTP pyrophosphatase MutT (NUDIX family)
MPADLVGAATRAIPPGTAEAWFRLPLTPAAVLLPLVQRRGEWHLVLTQRQANLPEHPGQVALPGGRVSNEDTDLIATALRESAEEIGLQPQAVTVAGFVKPQPIISGYAVLPVVGFVADGFTPQPDHREVAAVFEVPLQFLLQPGNCRASMRERAGVALRVWEYQHSGFRIWGATAKIIREFTQLLAAGDSLAPAAAPPAGSAGEGHG